LIHINQQNEFPAMIGLAAQDANRYRFAADLRDKDFPE